MRVHNKREIGEACKGPGHCTKASHDGAMTSPAEFSHQLISNITRSVTRQVPFSGSDGIVPGKEVKNAAGKVPTGISEMESEGRIVSIKRDPPNSLLELWSLKPYPDCSFIKKRTSEFPIEN